MKKRIVARTYLFFFTLFFALIQPYGFATDAAKCLKLGEESSVGGVPQGDKWVLNPPCCKPLIDREPKRMESLPPYGGGYIYACIACGDGKCDAKYESHKNCPEDCADKKTAPPPKSDR